MKINYVIKSNKVKPGKGKFLISEPLMQDPFFKRSVVLLIDYSETEGAIGVILNKPLEIKLQKIVDKVPEVNLRVFLGGPVNLENIYFLHSVGDKIKNSIEITKNVYWGGNFIDIQNFLTNQEIDETTMRFFVGYAGWSPKQLEDEIQRNSWAVLENKVPNLWKIKPELLWNVLVRKLGKDFLFWTNLPDDPRLN